MMVGVGERLQGYSWGDLVDTKEREAVDARWCWGKVADVKAGEIAVIADVKLGESRLTRTVTKINN
jgi:hypothetical protein